MKKSALVLIFSLALGSAPAQALDPTKVAPAVTKFAESAALQNPAIQIVDLSTGEIVYSRDAYRPRKPASTLKLISAVAAYTYLQPGATFPTSVYVGLKGKSIVIRGSYDPWISYQEPEATKMLRTSLPKIGFNALSAIREEFNGSTKGLTVYYSNLWPRDVANLKVFFKKRGLRPVIKRVSADDSLAMAGSEIRTTNSPDLATMVNWALTWSDNDVSTNIAKLASQAAGNGLSAEGVNKTFHSMLTSMGIDNDVLVAKDGSGLSYENQVSADLLNKVLVKAHSDPALSMIINGLPVGGKTGTLRHRFIETSPDAVGLVKAKTGTLRTTVSLAGYVESGDREYAFVIISDHIRSGASYHARARKAVDLLLGRLAEPLALSRTADIPNVIPEGDSTTALTNN